MRKDEAGAIALLKIIITALLLLAAWNIAQVVQVMGGLRFYVLHP